MDFDQYANILKQSSAEQQAWSAEQAQKQMGFQWAMSSTAHQREMEDLKKAGLNPILAANTGASSAAGAMGQTDSGLTGALAGIMEKMIDVNMVSAQAALKSAGTGYGFSSSAKSVASEMEGLDIFAMLLERSLGLNPSSNEGRAAREWMLDQFGDSWLGKFLLGENSSSAKTQADNKENNKGVLGWLSNQLDWAKKAFSKEGAQQAAKGAKIVGKAISDFVKKHVSVSNPFKK